VKRQRLSLSASGWLEIVSVWLLFRLAFIFNLRLARVGCVSGRQFQSPKLAGLGLAAELAGKPGTVAWRRVSLGPKSVCESLRFG